VGVVCGCGQHHRLLVLATALSSEGRTCYICRKKQHAQNDKCMSGLQFEFHNLLGSHSLFKGWVTVHESTTLMPLWKARVDATIVAPCKLHIQVDGHEHLHESSKKLRDASSHCAALQQCAAVVRVHPNLLSNVSLAEAAAAVASAADWRNKFPDQGAVFLSLLCEQEYIAYHKDAIINKCGSCKETQLDDCWVILSL